MIEQRASGVPAEIVELLGRRAGSVWTALDVAMVRGLLERLSDASAGPRREAAALGDLGEMPDDLLLAVTEAAARARYRGFWNVMTGEAQRKLATDYRAAFLVAWPLIAEHFTAVSSVGEPGEQQP